MRCKTLLFSLLALPLLMSCGAAEREVSQPLIIQGQADGSWGSSVVLVSDLELGSCTGAVLGSRHVLTGAHCVQGGTGQPFVNVYGPGSSNPQRERWNVTRFDVPEGVDATRLDFLTVDRRFADLAVLTLDRSLPSWIRPLPLAENYPGRGASVIVLGSGEHDGDLNSGAELRSRNARLFGSSDAGGAIIMDGTFTNGGDSGAPILTRKSDGSWQQLGILNGSVEYQGRVLDRYSSVHETRNQTWIKQILQRTL